LFTYVWTSEIARHNIAVDCYVLDIVGTLHLFEEKPRKIEGEAKYSTELTALERLLSLADVVDTIVIACVIARAIGSLG